MSWNSRVRWTRTERNGIIVLFGLVLLLAALKGPLCRKLTPERRLALPENYRQLARQIDSAGQWNSKRRPYEIHYGSPGKYLTEPAASKDPIEINSATMAELESLYGIGPVLAARIVKFRDGMGGFRSLDQLKDVYGLKPEVYEQIRPRLRIRPSAIHKLDLNTATPEELAGHPYIPPTLARQIVGYRTKVKPFESVEDARALYYLQDHPDLYEKLSPYLTVN